MWTEIAKRFEGRRNVFGYNILNEPWPGTPYPNCVSPTGCPALDASLLQPFTEKVIEAIREVDQDNLVWYAPWLVFDFGADTSLADTGDENAGFAFNMYCLGDAIPGGGGGASCDTGYDLTLANAEAQTEETGDALLMTEYAATQDIETITRVTELADQAMIGWQQWHYCDCDDPDHDRHRSPVARLQTRRKPPRGENLSREKLAISSRPYPRAVAGTPLGYEFNPETREFSMSYSVRGPDGKKLPRKVRTEIFMPPAHYRDGYSVTADGARSHAGKRVIRLKRVRGASEVTVEVSPEAPESRVVIRSR